MSTLQNRVAELETQKQADSAELAELRSNTDDQLAALKRDTEATILIMANQVGDIHGSLKTLETSMHKGLAAQTAATTALGNELRTMLQQLIEKANAPAQPASQTDAPASQKRAGSRSLSRDSRSPRRAGSRQRSNR